MKNILIVLLALIVLLGGGYLVKEKNSESGSDTPVLDNTIDNVDETTISGLSGETLDLSGKNLTKAPEYIFNMTNLVGLDLSGNQLTGALQSQIGQLKKLRVLDLSDNEFTGVPAEVGQLANLETLDLSNNLLTGLPYELGNLSKLKLLDLSGNNYSEADLTKIKESLPSTTVIKTN